MPLYSAVQLIDKTILLNKDVNVYSVYDIDTLGDNAKPIAIMRAGSTFTMDSFLGQTAGYTDSYGITYAPRQQPYLTFYDGGNYDAIAVISDGRFSLQALKDQGALTVAEETAAKNEAEKSALDKFLGNFGSGLGNFLIIGGSIALGVLLLPSVIRSVKEAGKKN